MINETRTIYDTDTGEVFSNKKKNYNILDEKKGYYLRYNSKSIKQYQDIRLSEFITDRADFMRMHLLAENIYRDTNELMIRVSTRKVRYMTIKDISLLIDLCERRTIEFINRMIKLEVMAKQTVEVGEVEFVVYTLNPLFFNSCKYLSPNLYFMFENTLKHYIPANIQKWYHDIGNIKKEEGS